ncbi:hypothetical protein H8B09_15755 [Paenibacillus sp. PR3]|uniref:Uncharacterized protein n=1 Tax=Paenibacillus terricola TaxID=2763503 RepID=A0ABR8MY18_9BACL|nr:hypothetical protein [Paenibacillus terricola]MBD3920221.1 hypothetical protein [Paenibacillus terricola]
MQVLKAIGTFVITIAVTLAVVQWLPVKGEGTTVVHAPRTNESTSRASSLEQPDGLIVDGLKLQQQGYYTNSDFTYDLIMSRYGPVKFVTAERSDNGYDELKFIIVDEKENIVDELPDFIGESYGRFDHVSHVYMRDVNGDALKDVIVIAQYKTGDEKSGAVDLPVTGVYFQTEDGFTSVASIDEELNEKGITNNVAEVLMYLKRMQLDK